MTASRAYPVNPLLKTWFLSSWSSPLSISLLTDPTSCCGFSIKLIPSNPTEKSTDLIRRNEIFQLYSSFFPKNSWIIFIVGIVKEFDDVAEISILCNKNRIFREGLY